jgi:hypothetical protein
MKYIIFNIILLFVFPVLIMLGNNKLLPIGFGDLILDFYFLIILLSFISLIITLVKYKFSIFTMVNFILFLLTFFVVVDSLKYFRTV